MGGASAKHAPEVTPIITEDSNPLSDRGRHLPSPPLQAQATITEKTTRAYGRSKRQPCFTNHLSKLEPSVRQCKPAVS